MDDAVCPRWGEWACGSCLMRHSHRSPSSAVYSMSQREWIFLRQEPPLFVRHRTSAQSGRAVKVPGQENVWSAPMSARPWAHKESLPEGPLPFITAPQVPFSQHRPHCLMAAARWRSLDRSPYRLSGTEAAFPACLQRRNSQGHLLSSTRQPSDPPRPTFCQAPKAGRSLDHTLKAP